MEIEVEGIRMGQMQDLLQSVCCSPSTQPVRYHMLSLECTIADSLGMGINNLKKKSLLSQLTFPVD